jgi:hypothetical protein
MSANALKWRNMQEGVQGRTDGIIFNLFFLPSGKFYLYISHIHWEAICLVHSAGCNNLEYGKWLADVWLQARRIEQTKYDDYFTGLNHEKN